ncbi:hypothetical protein DPMN_140724 [Dreissena polymorpha]|uniref:Uncharacterized protein n=1 Tax=Dreissena polymorpha TaxID=45954 RepID=A0A9D4G850_DREPO|nr:hypothetical protein DPMN_140724 [Dreissena polymorpha]
MISCYNLRLVHGHIAGIPESQDLMELKKCPSFNPAISVSDLLITNLERVEPYRSPPTGFPRQVKISFLTSVPVPTQIFVRDTNVALDIRPCPVTPTRCFNCQGFGHIASRSKCPSVTSCCRCAGPNCQRRCTNKVR